MMYDNIYKYEKFFYNMNGEKIRDDIYNAILELECNPDFENTNDIELLLILEGIKEGIESIQDLLQELQDNYI